MSSVRDKNIKLNLKEYELLEKVKQLVTICGTHSFSDEAKKIVQENGALGCLVHLGCQLVIEHFMSIFPEEVKACLS